MLDITGRKRADEQVAFLAYHDELTGLPNRAMFEELLELSIARARRHDGAVAVLCVDLDDFRLVNDSLGHEAGDALLVAGRRPPARGDRATPTSSRGAAATSSCCCSRTSTATRSPATRRRGASRRVGRAADPPGVRRAVHGRRDRGLHQRRASGISLFPHDADAAATLIRNAEAAMFEAKQAGSARLRALRAAPRSDSGARLQFVTRLRKAVDAQRWTLHYQPVIDAAGRRAWSASRR